MLARPVCVSVCESVYIHTYIYNIIYICTPPTCMYTNTYMYIHIYVYANTYMYIHTCLGIFSADATVEEEETAAHGVEPVDVQGF